MNRPCADRGSYWRTWQKTERLTNSLTGTIVDNVAKLTELGNGVCYQDSNGQWVDSQDLIELTPTGAAGMRGPLKAHFSPNLNASGAINVTVSGQFFQSHPIGLYCRDLASGKVALIASVPRTASECWRRPTRWCIPTRSRHSGDPDPNDYFDNNAYPRVLANPVDGHVYLVFPDLPSAGYTGNDHGDIFIQEGVPNADGSLNWSTATKDIKVNHDKTQTDQWNPAVTVNPAGTMVFVGCYSRQQDPNNNSLIMEHFCADDCAWSGADSSYFYFVWCDRSDHCTNRWGGTDYIRADPNIRLGKIKQ